MKRSVIIPHRGNPLGLWTTICACENANPDDELEYCVLVNGRKVDEPLLVMQDRMGERFKFDCYVDSVPPPIARDLAVKMATGEALYFVDDHVSPTWGWFRLMQPSAHQLLFSSYRTHPGTRVVNRYFHFIPDQKLPTKGDYATAPESQNETYRVISGPNGGFSMLRSTWNIIGGYGDWFQGFGGEEAYLGYKAWMAGVEVLMVPNALYYHFSCRSETRGYSKEINPWNYEEGLRRLGPENVQRVLDSLK